MKLLVHNFLSSKFLKGVNVGYPLKLIANDVQVIQQEFNLEFIKRMLSRLEWSALKEAADSIGHGQGLPTEPISPEAIDNSSEDVLKAVHHVLLEVDVIEGQLECPETGRKFPISKGIPNMLVNEDEINE